MKICMIGAGYVGLVSAACFAEFGWNVTCVDKNLEWITKLKYGEIPIYEPGLDELLERNIATGRLRFTNGLPTAVSEAELVFLAVGTPMRRGDGFADLSFIFEAVDELAPHLTGSTVVATKSTVPVGTSREIEQRLRGLRPDADVAICSNPEFLREGSAIKDFMHPDRVLIGCDDARCREIMERLYQPLALRKAPLLFVSRESAGLAKYAANSFLAMKISFINEIADLCEAVGSDVQEVAAAIGADGRIGDKFLHPGPGYGGSCFPKDVSALIRTAREAGAPLSLVEQVEKVNTERKIAMATRIQEAVGGSLRGKTIAVLGVTFKPKTDDVRDAPSLTIIPMLQARGASIRAYDPQALQAKPLLTDVEWCGGPFETATGADVLLLLTEWNEFRALELAQVRQVMRGNILIDLRNVYPPSQADDAGFLHFSLGRTGEWISTRNHMRRCSTALVQTNRVASAL